ncbi:MAG: ADP-glyceromanno-heptose 6-epimerase [Victivallaceae bacterium]|nr:ADP-glyceromanno-heptose 6-epimerase [Victivallaceae bacterium]
MYIVTGAAGLIGSAVVWLLNKRGVTDIIAVDHLGNGDKWKNLVPLAFDSYFEKDVFRQELRKGFFDKFEIAGVFHLGACSATTETDAGYLMANNYMYTRALAEWCVERGVKMMYASSCATYGDGTNGYSDDESSLEKLRPLNMYGYSKQLFDLHAKRHGLLDSIFGCKFSNIYGPNEWHKGNMRSVALRAYEQISSTGKLELFKSYKDEYKNGEQKRDFLYVKDAAAMIMHLFDSNAHGIYNIGSGKAETWNSLARAMFKALGKPVKIKYVDMPEPLRERYQYYTCADMAKFRSTGYDRPVMSLDDAVADYCHNHLLGQRHLGD